LTPISPLNASTCCFDNYRCVSRARCVGGDRLVVDCTTIGCARRAYSWQHADPNVIVRGPLPETAQTFSPSFWRAFPRSKTLLDRNVQIPDYRFCGKSLEFRKIVLSKLVLRQINTSFGV
jgi:hypothetical protein